MGFLYQIMNTMEIPLEQTKKVLGKKKIRDRIDLQAPFKDIIFIKVHNSKAKEDEQNKNQ